MNDFKDLFISRGVRWALSKIYDEAFYEPLTIFAKKLHHRCSTVF